MGRTRIVAPTPVRPKALVASAMPVKIIKDFIKASQSASGWQREAWRFYDIIGEYRYSVDWVGSMLSKAVLSAAVMGPKGPEDVTTGPAFEIMDQFFGGRDGQADMLRLVGIHFTVAGECYLLGRVLNGRDLWQVVAATRLTHGGADKNGRLIWRVDGEKVESDEAILVIRLWRPHPERPLEATSPSRAILPILAEIEGLTEHVHAQVNSRLAGAGVFMLPSEIEYPAVPQSGDPDGTAAPLTGASGLTALLTKAMETALQDRADASSLVPIVITAPGAEIGNARYITFWTPLDEHSVELRSEALRRLALGMDMPPEVLSGVAEANHWAAWAIDESAIKGHTEPLLQIITYSLAEGYLRPAVEATEGYEGDAALLTVAADTSEMRLRPNRSKEAFELYDRGWLKGQSLLRETGFDPGDALEGEELATWFLRKVASGSTTPELVAWALQALDVPIPELPTISGTTQEARPTPSLVDHPYEGPPEQERSRARAAGLVASADAAVGRALERAGNRIKTRLQGTVPPVAAASLYLMAEVKPNDLDMYLHDAWGTLPVIAERYRVSETTLRGVLDAYCRALITDQRPHVYESFANYLSAAFGLPVEGVLS